MRDTYTIADELVNVAHVAMYTMLSHSHKDDLGDLTQKKGANSKSEHVLGTKECMYTLVRQKGIW